MPQADKDATFMKGFFTSEDPGAVGAGLFWCDPDDGTFRLRNSANDDWIQFGGGVSIPEGNVSQLLTGGQVVWETGLTFRVSAATYSINGAAVSSEEQTITLTAADATNPRIDVIGLDVNGDAFKVTGTPATPAGEPSVDPETQLKLVLVTVPANATVPSVSNNSIYAEGAGGEWTDTTSGTGWTLDSTTGPRAGTKSEEATGVAANAYIQWESPTNPIDFTTVQQLVLNIKSKAVWPANKMLRVGFRLAGALKGVEITVKDGFWGFDSSIVSGYQQVAIPIGNFQLGANTVNQLRATVVGSGATIGFYIDDVFLQLGTGMSGTSPGTPLATTQIAGIVKLATNGQNAPNVVVQGNDNRLAGASADARTGVGYTDANSIALEFDTTQTIFTWDVNPTLVDYNTTFPGHCYIVCDGNVACVGTTAWAPPAGFDLRMKLSLGSDQQFNGNIGLVIGNSAMTIYPLTYLNDSWSIGSIFNNGGFGGTGSSPGSQNSVIYIRIRRPIGDTTHFYQSHSVDGKTWREHHTGLLLPGVAPAAKIGVRINSLAVGNNLRAAIDWIRGDFLQ